ncbi:MAG TPA: DUF1992 domain-containing protein [Microlunatus sp.]|nr:DUF1992 domain-containing protein [Microlunatus sp.]
MRMAERYESWVDRQVREAIERGEFDNLPGQGKPIRGLNGRQDENWWIRQKLEKEDIRGALPTSLSLRREVEDLPDILAGETDEHAVREIIEDLNARIRDAVARRVEGPVVFIRTVDVESAVAVWREGRL